MDNPRAFRLPITAGPHTIGVALVDRQRGAGVDDIYSDFRDRRRVHAGRRRADTVTIIGPFNATGAGDTPSRRRIFVCRPARCGGASRAERRAAAANAEHPAHAI